MAGVRWVTERRILRRASHQSLKVPVFRDQSFDALSQNPPAAAYARGDWDAEYRRADSAASVRELSRSAPTRTADQDRLPASPPPSVNTLTFKPAARPWYGSQRMVLLVLGVAAIAMVVCIGVLVARNAGAGNGESTTVTPTGTTNAVPAPPPPPPLDVVGDQPLPTGDVPPPPPPPADESGAAPTNSGSYPRYQPSQSGGTATGRPQTPVQISAAPSVTKPPPPPGHSAPGDAPTRHRGFF